MKALREFFDWLFGRDKKSPEPTPFKKHLMKEAECKHQFTRTEHYWGDDLKCSKCGKPMEGMDLYDR